MNILLNIASETFRLFFEMSPYLILGFFFSGLLHIVIGEKYIKKHFSKGGITAAVKAALFGIPLPVCSCGVIPLAESMNRDGASKSSTMAFLYIFLIITISISFGLFFDLLVKQSNLNFSFVSLGGSFLPHTLKIISGIILGIIFLYSKLDLERFKMNKIKNAYRINVPDMTCQHCKTKIGNAISKKSSKKIPIQF